MTVHTPDKTAEAALIARCKKGDQNAIGELFRSHYSQSLKVATVILRRDEDARDAVQSAFLLAFRRIGSFRGESSFKTWVTRIVVNCCLLQLRTRNRATLVQFEDRNGACGSDAFISKSPTPEVSAWSSEVGAAVSRAVSMLPKHLQEPYALFTFSGCPLEEVAALLGLTVAATKTRLFRARAGMRVSLHPIWARRRPS
jgi:RNA polymerase sigma-70 factor, ECF subfamily